MADQTDPSRAAPVPETGVAELGLFGKPLFQDPGARALARVGVVDVGSNSVRLVVFDGAVQQIGRWHGPVGAYRRRHGGGARCQ